MSASNCRLNQGDRGVLITASMSGKVYDALLFTKVLFRLSSLVGVVNCDGGSSVLASLRKFLLWCLCALSDGGAGVFVGFLIPLFFYILCRHGF